MAPREYELVPQGVWPRSNDDERPQLATVLFTIAHFLEGVGYTQALQAIRNEAQERGITLPEAEQWDDWNSYYNYKYLMDFWSATNGDFPTMPDHIEDGALIDDEAEETSNDSSDEESESDEDSDSSAQVGSKRKRVLTPESSSNSSSDDDESSSDESESESDDRPLKRQKVQADDAGNERVHSSDDDSDSSSSDDSDDPPLQRKKASNDDEALQSKADVAEDSSSDSDSESSSSDESETKPGAKASNNFASSDSGSSSESSDDSSSESESEKEAPAPPPSPPKKSKKSKKTKSETKESGQTKSENQNPSANASANSSTTSVTLRPESPIVLIPRNEAKATDALLLVDDSNASDGTKKVPANEMNVKKLRKEQVPFSRIPADQKIDPKFASNAYVPYDYANRAYHDLSVTKGKGFTKEKNKKKRGESSTKRQSSWQRKKLEEEFGWAMSPPDEEYDPAVDGMFDDNFFGFKEDTFAFMSGCGFNPMRGGW